MRIKPTKIKFIRFVQLVVPLNHPQISTNFHKLTFVVGICWWIEKCFINLWCLHADGDFGRREGVHRGAQWCGDSSIRKGVYFALFLALRKPEKLLLQSRNLATIDAHRYAI